MVRRTARAALGSFRAWGPELVCLALCLLIWGYAGGLGDALAVALVLGIGWWMGHRHHTLKLHSKIDGLVAGWRAFLAGQEGAAGTGERPTLTVHHGGKR
jgi:hypothetical protein